MTLREKFDQEFAGLKKLHGKDIVEDVLTDKVILAEVSHFFHTYIIPRLEEKITNYLSSGATVYTYVGKFDLQVQINSKNEAILDHDYAHRLPAFISTSDHELLFKYFTKIAKNHDLTVIADDFEGMKYWVISIAF